MRHKRKQSTCSLFELLSSAMFEDSRKRPGFQIRIAIAVTSNQKTQQGAITATQGQFLESISPARLASFMLTSIFRE